jgi:hypothetical protein
LVNQSVGRLVSWLSIDWSVSRLVGRWFADWFFCKFLRCMQWQLSLFIAHLLFHRISAAVLCCSPPLTAALQYLQNAAEFF